MHTVCFDDADPSSQCTLCCSVPVSCKAAGSLRCCTPFSSSSSSVLMLVTTSPSKPTSAMPFQKFSVSSVNRQTTYTQVSGGSVFICVLSSTETIIIVRLILCVGMRALCDLRSHLIPSCLQNPVRLSSSPPSHSLPCPRPLHRRYPGPPELQFTQENMHCYMNIPVSEMWGSTVKKHCTQHLAGQTRPITHSFEMVREPSHSMLFPLSRKQARPIATTDLTWGGLYAMTHWGVSETAVLVCVPADKTIKLSQRCCLSVLWLRIWPTMHRGWRELDIAHRSVERLQLKASLLPYV